MNPFRITNRADKEYNQSNQTRRDNEIARALNKIAENYNGLNTRVRDIGLQVTKNQAVEIDLLSYIRFYQETDDSNPAAPVEKANALVVIRSGHNFLTAAQYRWHSQRGINDAASWVEMEQIIDPESPGGYYFHAVEDIAEAPKPIASYMEIRVLGPGGAVYAHEVSQFDADRQPRLLGWDLYWGSFNGLTWPLYLSYTMDEDSESLEYWHDSEGPADADDEAIFNTPGHSGVVNGRKSIDILLANIPVSTLESDSEYHVIVRARHGLSGTGKKGPEMEYRKVIAPLDPGEASVASEFYTASRRATLNLSFNHATGFEDTRVEYAGTIRYTGDPIIYTVSGTLQGLIGDPFKYMYFDPSISAVSLQLGTKEVATTIDKQRVFVGAFKPAGSTGEFAVWVDPGDQLVVTAPFMYVASLAAINAYLGRVTGGELEFGTDNKMWFNVGGNGAFAIGGTDPDTAPFRVSATGELITTLGTVAALDNRVTTAEASIVVLDNQIALKASQTDLDTLDNSVEGIDQRLVAAEASITVNASTIVLKANQTVVDSLDTAIGLIDTRVTTAESSITVNTNAIALRATITDVNTLEGRVTTAEAAIVVNTNAITLKATQTDLNDLTGRVTSAEASIVVNANAIALKASQSSVDAIDGRVTSAEASILVNASNIALKVSQTTFDALENRMSSAETQITTNVNQIALKASITTVNALDSRVSSAESSIIVNANAIALRATTSALDAVDGRLTTAEASIVTNANAIALRVTQATFDSLNTRVGTAETNITANANAITLKAATSTVSALDGRVTTAEASIVTNATNIALKVDASGIINAINISSEGIAISGSRLHVTADTIFDSDVTIHGILSAVSGTFDTLTMAVAGSISFAGGGQLGPRSLQAGSSTLYLGGQGIDIGNGLIFVNEDNGSISIAAGSASTVSITAPNGITMGDIVAGTWNGTAIAAAKIGSLPASQIGSGTFATARIPDLSSTYLTVAGGATGTVNVFELDNAGAGGSTRYRSTPLTYVNGKLTAIGTPGSWTGVIAGA